MPVRITDADIERARERLAEIMDKEGWPAALALGYRIAEFLRDEAEVRGDEWAPSAKGRRRLAGAADRLEGALARAGDVLDDEQLW